MGEGWLAVERRPQIPAFESPRRGSGVAGRRTGAARFPRGCGSAARRPPASLGGSAVLGRRFGVSSGSLFSSLDFEPLQRHTRVMEHCIRRLPEVLSIWGKKQSFSTESVDLRS